MSGMLQIPTKSEIIQELVDGGASPEDAEAAADLVISKVGKANDLMNAIEGAYKPMLEAMHADSLALPEDERAAFLVENVVELAGQVSASGLHPAFCLMILAYMLEVVRHTEGDRLAHLHPERVEKTDGHEYYKMTKPEGYVSRLAAALDAAPTSKAFENLAKQLSRQA